MTVFYAFIFALLAACVVLLLVIVSCLMDIRKNMRDNHMEFIELYKCEYFNRNRSIELTPEQFAKFCRFLDVYGRGD